MPNKEQTRYKLYKEQKGPQSISTRGQAANGCHSFGCQGRKLRKVSKALIKNTCSLVRDKVMNYHLEN